MDELETAWDAIYWILLFEHVSEHGFVANGIINSYITTSPASISQGGTKVDNSTSEQDNNNAFLDALSRSTPA